MMQAFRTISITSVVALCLAAQTPPGASTTTSPTSQNPPAQTEIKTTEIATSQESKVTFSTRVNLVAVPVVVRDRHGKAVGNLTKEDFQLFDRGKIQSISRFSVEKAGERAATEAAQLEETAAASGIDPKSGSAVIPTRFVAYLVDDVHVEFGDLVHVRTAAAKHINETMQPTDRAAIFTTSGINNIDFTDDKQALIDALNRIVPHTRMSGNADCPNLTLYQADLIRNHNDPQALNAAVSDTIQCASLIPIATAGTGSRGSTSTPLSPADLQMAKNMADTAASRALALGDSETQQSLRVLREVIRRMSLTPGMRQIVLISPGFLITTNYRQDEQEMMDRAVHANVVVSTLDARGLYTVQTNAEIISGQYNAQAKLQEDMYRRAAILSEEDTLAEIAEGTGGIFFKNSNDLGEGLKRTAAAPEYIYLLGFSPQNLRYDGTLHNLKVSLKVKGLELQARRGYYAPKHAPNEAEQAKEEIREAMYSREEVQEFPVTMQSQFFKPSTATARLSVVAHVDIKLLKFETMEGRHKDQLTVTSGLFDRNGNMIAAVTKTVDMAIKDETFNDRMASGVTAKITFDVQPGKYLLRLVVRDSGGQMMSARNGIVEIP
jgi:VWFA-related protein